MNNLDGVLKKIGKKFEVLEDNGGGIQLFIFDENRKVEYAHIGYEFVPGQLVKDLKDLADGSNPKEDWEGNEDDPQAMYDDVTSLESGWVTKLLQ